MIEFYDSEGMCQDTFEKLGRCWHLWTGENFETIFCDEEDFKDGMALLAICAMLFPGVKILTFELMSNHLHIALAGKEEDVLSFFELLKRFLSLLLRGKCRQLSLKDFKCNLRLLETLSDCRNTIAYINRNGYVARQDHSPITYPWGANACFFNPPSFQLYQMSDDLMTVREKRRLSHTHLADHLKGLIRVNGVVSPWCFCFVQDAEALFRGPAHYFYCVSRSVESNKQIANEIGERVYYTDDEFYSVVASMAAKKYSTQIRLLSRDAKIDLAKSMHFEYNASNKQISRLLKLDVNVVASLFPKGR